MNFIDLLFGHLVGDYLLQNKWMAMNKNANNLKAIVHCLIYTVSIALFTSWNIYWLLWVFSTHFLIDRFSLADKWLNLINGRSLSDFLNRGSVEYGAGSNSHVLRGGFTALVYAVVDNTMHLLLMYYGYLYIGF